MVDHPAVCCMCGDVGFPDKLFHCSRCRSRFQHSYCSNYYIDSSATVAGFCDWCQSEERSTKHGGSTKRAAGKDAGAVNRSEYLGEKIKVHEREESSDRRKNPSGTPSPRPGGRRYKLLKDVLC